MLERFREWRRGWIRRQVQRVNRRLYRDFDARIQGGVFRGVRYIDEYVCGSLSPKLIGCYEEELYPLFEKLIARGFDQVLNVGCGEGFYAVGLATRMPDVKVLAYVTNPKARALCAKLATLNRVSDRIDLLGFCDHPEFRRRLGPPTLVVMDCKSYETTLLDPEKLPELRQAEVVVELHAFIDPTVSATLRQRFPGSEVQIIETVARKQADYPCLAALSPEDAHWALAEHRPGRMEWYYLPSLAAAGNS